MYKHAEIINYWFLPSMQSQILTLFHKLKFKLNLPSASLSNFIFREKPSQNPRDETDSARPMGDHSWHHPHARIGECNSRNARKCNHDRVCVPEL